MQSGSSGKTLTLMTILVPDFQLDVKRRNQGLPTDRLLSRLTLRRLSPRLPLQLQTLANLGTDMALNTPMAPVAHRIMQDTISQHVY